jgi:hypothetical protein
MIDPIYKIRFVEIWFNALAAGLSSAESREYAAIVLAEQGIKP